VDGVHLQVLVEADHQVGVDMEVVEGLVAQHPVMRQRAAAILLGVEGWIVLVNLVALVSQMVMVLEQVDEITHTLSLAMTNTVTVLVELLAQLGVMVIKVGWAVILNGKAVLREMMASEATTVLMVLAMELLV